MKSYIVPFLAYILVSQLFGLVIDGNFAYLIGIFLTGLFVIYFWKTYKVKWKIDIVTAIVGIVIFLVWVGLEGFNPLLGESEFVPYSTFQVFFKLFAMITVVPIVEELFTRDFLIRYLTAKDWKQVRIGTFTWPSFIVTVLFFGFSHNRWFAGIIVGILLNLLLYRTKKLGNCIVAHAFANFILGVYVIYSNSWYLW